MPYIKPKDRERLQLNDMGLIRNAGELQYVIALLIKEYLFTIKVTKGEWRYQDLNDIIGALEGAKLEFYRRIAVPYEDAKMAENGDVYS